MQNLGISVPIIGQDLLSGPANAGSAALTGLEKTAGIVTSAFGGLGKGILAVGAALTAVTAAITATVAVGVQKAGELQQAVANISSIKPTINTDSLFSSLNLMQTRVAASSKEMGAALYDIFSSIDVGAKQGLELVEKFAKGAIASITDAKTFGTAVVGELNAFKLGIEQTDHLMDVFFNTVKLGVVTGAELAQNLGQVTQAAKQAGIGVEAMSALIAGVTKEGGSAADNMEHLTRLLEELHTKAADSGFKFLGIQATEMGGKLKDPIQLLTELRDRMANFTESARQTALMEIFPNIRARQAAMVVMNELDTVNAGLEDNQTKTGATADAYAKMSATFDVQTKLLRQSFDSLLTSLGSGVLPVLTAVTSSTQKFVADTAPLFDKWQQRLKDAFKTGGFSAWLTEVGNVAGELGKQIEKWVPAFGGWVENGKTELGKALKKVYEETIVPWVTEKAGDLKKQFETVWVPNLVSWWNSAETQGKIKGAMDEFGGKVRDWAGEGGDGNKLFKEAGTSIGNALMVGLTGEFEKINKLLGDAETELRKWDTAAQNIIRAGSGNANAPGGASSSITFPRLPTVPGTENPASPSGSTSAPSGSTSTPSANQYNLNSPNLVPYQFSMDQELTKAEADAACGPAAAVGFAHIFGRNPTLKEALQLAKDKGLWDAANGMHGAGSEVALLGAMGISAHVEQGVDWAKIQAEIQAGRPAIIDTPNHYFEAQGYNAQTGQYNFGNTGRVYGPQNQWMTPEQLANVGAGAPRATIYADASNTNATKATDYKTLARAYAAQYGVDPDIYEAMIFEESGFDPTKVNPVSGARGIAQFMPGTGKSIAGQLNLSEQDFWGDPNSQLQGGALYLSQLMAQVGGDPAKALTAYNWGIGNVQGGGTAPGDTQAYVARILAAARAAKQSGAPSATPNADNPDDEETAPTTKPPTTPGTEDPYKMTPERWAAMLDTANGEQAAGSSGRAILQAFTDGVANVKPHALETLASAMAELKQKLFNDPQLSPEEAKAHYDDVMGSVTTAILDGGDEAVATARGKITELEQSLSIDKIQAAADKARKKIEDDADKAVAKAEFSRDKAIAALTTSKESAIADRDAEAAESDRITKAVDGAKVYVKAQEDQLDAVHALAKEERDFQDQRAALDLKYMEDLALIQTKKRATDTSGVLASTAHTDPQAAANQQLRDAAAAHNVDVFNLNQQQAIKAANHQQDVTWKLEETALASTLKATVLDPTAETAKTTLNAWKDNYALFTQIPREAATQWQNTKDAIDDIRKNESTALSQLATDSDTAKARVLALTDATGLPAVKSAADETFTQAVSDTDHILQNIIQINQLQTGYGAPSPYTNSGSTSTYSGPTGGPTGTGAGGPGGTFGNNPPPDPNPDPTDGGGESFGMGGLGLTQSAPSQLFEGGPTTGSQTRKSAPAPANFLDSVTDQMRDSLANGMIRAADDAATANPVVRALLDANGWGGANFASGQALQFTKLPPITPPMPWQSNPMMGLGASGYINPYGIVPTGGGLGGLSGGTWKLPGFAGGVQGFAGGMAMVGENGPEPVYLPPGSSVYPHGSTPMSEPIDYDRLGAAIARAQQQHPMMLDGAQVNQANRTRDNYYAQSNRSQGVGALVSA